MEVLKINTSFPTIISKNLVLPNSLLALHTNDNLNSISQIQSTNIIVLRYHLGYDYILFRYKDMFTYPPSLTILDISISSTQIRLTTSMLPPKIKELILSEYPPSFDINPIPDSLKNIYINSKYYLNFIINNQSISTKLNSLIKPIHNNSINQLFFKLYNKYK